MVNKTYLANRYYYIAFASIIITTTAGHPCIPPKSCPEGQRGHCVANSSLDECVDDACFERKTVPKGHIAVKDTFSGNLDLHECPTERYEPTNYHSDKKCGCQLRKSKCSGEGQMISNNGSTTEDRSCICDYTMGYRYSQTPNDICKCRPRKENCNCELEICDAGKILSPDYYCVNKTSMKENEFRCPRIENKRSSTPDRETITSVMTNTTGEISCSTCPGNNNCLAPNLTSGQLIVIGIAIGVIAVVIFIAIVKKRDYLKAKLDEFLDNLHLTSKKKYKRVEIEEKGQDKCTAAHNQTKDETCITVETDGGRLNDSAEEPKSDPRESITSPKTNIRDSASVDVHDSFTQNNALDSITAPNELSTSDMEDNTLNTTTAHTGELLQHIEELGQDEVTAVPIEVNTSDLEENTQKPTIGNSRAERSDYTSSQKPVTHIRVRENEKKHDDTLSEKMYDNADPTEEPTSDLRESIASPTTTPTSDIEDNTLNTTTVNAEEFHQDIEEKGQDKLTADIRHPEPVYVHNSDIQNNAPNSITGNSHAERTDYTSSQKPVTHIRVRENEKEHDDTLSEKMYDKAGNGSARLPLSPRDNDEQQGDKIDIHSNN